MKKIIFLVLFLKSFVFAVPSYTVPIVTYTHVYDSFVSGTCSVDVPNHYQTTLLKNLWGDVECYQKPDSVFQYLTYDTLRDYECSSNGDGTFTVAKSDKSISGTCTYACNLTDSICQDRLGDLNATVSFDDCTCVLPPPPPPDDLDDDGDTIPNKCDPDYVDYQTMDCDGDSQLNTYDNDIDGDGIPNINDTNPFVAGTDDLDLTCKGANIGGTSSLPFSFSTYSFISNDDDFKCGLLLLNSSVYDAVVSLDDINYPACEQSYCYAHKVKNECDFDVSFYRPSIYWDYIPYKTESQCELLVDGIKYSDSSYSVPDSLKCPNTSFCFVKRVDDTPPPENQNSEETDPTMSAPDLNSTTADLAPLLNAQNTTNKHLDDLKVKADITNNNLDDLKDTANKTLDVNKDMKSTLNSLKSNSDRSLENQSNSLSKLASINSAIDGASKKIGTMSDTLTGNQVIGNGHLSDISGKMTTNNTLLSDIKDSLSGDSTTLDTSANDGFSDLLTGDSDLINFVTTQFSTFKDNINANFTDINTQYSNAKSLFQNPLSSPNFSGSYSSSCFSFSFLGKNVVLDMSFLGVISPVVYFIMTLTFMILNFRFLLNHLLRGDN